jgi:solute carrier family 45 protein 1/2/4
MADDRTPPSSSSSGKLSDPPTPHPKVVSFRRGSRESNEYNEQSPLLPAAQPSGDNDRLKVLSPLDDDSDWDAEQEESKSSWFMLLLTLGGFG